MPIHYQLRATDFDAGARYLMKNNQLIRQQFIQTEIASITTGMIMILILPYFVFRAQYLYNSSYFSGAYDGVFLWLSLLHPQELHQTLHENINK